MKTEYVLGFMFSEDQRHVGLISKLKPTWQRGKLNGIGGKVEPDETALAAIVREFWEETGVQTTESDWEEYNIMEGPDWKVSVFRAFTEELYKIKSMTPERVGVYRTLEINQESILQNLGWLIPMALDEEVEHSLVGY